jgi:TIR domain
MSLADLPELVGFFSYSREDDEYPPGALSKLRERIQQELRSQLGRHRADFRVWQDKAAIAHGKLWDDEIRTAIAQSVFFIPIVTPTAIKSRHCKFEFESFLGREAALGRNDLVFPLLYIRVPALEDESRWRQDPVLNIIGSRQYIDWQNLRHVDVGSTDVAVAVERFCKNIFEALQRPWVSPEEQRKRAEAEARQAAEEQGRREELEATQRAKEEARRKSIAAEQERVRQEVEAQAAEDGRRKQPELEGQRFASAKRQESQIVKPTEAPIAEDKKAPTETSNAKGPISPPSIGAILIGLYVLTTVTLWLFDLTINYSALLSGDFGSVISKKAKPGDFSPLNFPRQ